ncbi:MAG: hypothetical protein U0074_08505 [Kouleothrix sp.]
MMVNRIRRQNVDGSMKTILAYARGTVESLNSAIAKNAEMYGKLQTTDGDLSRKLVENQPKYEQWRLEAKRLTRSPSSTGVSRWPMKRPMPSYRPSAHSCKPARQG